MSEERPRDRRSPRVTRPARARNPTESDDEFDRLLDYLKRQRRFDFTGYKRAGLARRVSKRMVAVQVTGFADYISFLESHPDELLLLVNTILINVTAFFRDDLPWAFLRSEILPRLLARKGMATPIRVWCAGCATGEEAYTLSIVLAEALGHEQFRERVKLYATDVDEEALAIARQGSYPEQELAEVPAELVEKYFERQAQRFTFRKDLRRSIIFGRNDLMQDAPISRIDLLACRNTLMYFDTGTQARILERFHFALTESGFMMLGKAETLLAHNTLFTPVDLKHRVFSKVPRPVMRDRPAPVTLARPEGEEEEARHEEDDVLLREGAFDGGTEPQIVVDRGGRLVLANARARSLFRLGSDDVGQLLQDLELSYRPFELRSVIDETNADRRSVSRTEVPWRTPEGDSRWFDILALPVMRADGELAGTSISFSEVSRHKQLQDQVEQARRALEAAYQELQSTNEELETTNEELHSTVEELETTNEELQSTNEELETMNEELQSTNEELQAINDELRARGDELNQLNALLDSTFTSLKAGATVLDRELRVLVWNGRAEEMWGVRASEAEGALFVSLDIGLPVDRLMPPIRSCLAGAAESLMVTVPATNRRGRAIGCQVTMVPLMRRGDERVHGVIVLMEEVSAESGAVGGVQEGPEVGDKRSNENGER